MSISTAYAQEGTNPFAKYGYKVHVQNTIMGRSVVHDRQKIVAIGSVLFDTKNNTIVGDFESDSTVFWLEPQTVSMFVADIGRFTTPDPLAEKYYNISPYAYVANNPINAIDPDGRDIIVLNDPKGAGNRGHSAILIGNDKTGWQYISKYASRGDNYIDLFKGSPSIVNNPERFKTLEAFREAQNDDPYYGKYTQEVRFSSDTKQDKKAEKAALKSAESWYHFLFNNCVDAVSAGLKAAGFNPGYSGSGKETDVMIDFMSPIPNSRFQRIQENNSKQNIPIDNSPEEENKDIGMILQRFLMQNPNIKVNVF